MGASHTDETWPPQSVQEVLLNSPGGREKYADFQPGLTASPIKRAAGTPSLLERLRQARNNEERFPDKKEDSDEDDEETLQLQLAAIEAKLKLKKLQKRMRKEDDISPSRPASASKALTPSIQVALSPTRQPFVSDEQRSPNRILLGIDKGKKGADVSLRRAKSNGASPIRKQAEGYLGDSNRTGDRIPLKHTFGSQKAKPVTQIKSFSERMAEVRDKDKEQADKREDAVRARTRKFKFDATEMERYRVDANEAQSRGESHHTHRDTNHNDVGQDSNYLERYAGLRKAKTLPDLRKANGEGIGDATLFEGFSGLHLTSRILPHTFLKRTLPPEQYTIYRIPDLLKNVTSPAYEIPDDVGDFVVFGIIASKSMPLDQKMRANEVVKNTSEWDGKWDDGSQNRKRFMALTLTDLTWTLDLFLFDTALPRYHRLSPGTVIAVLNPTIMPPKKGRENTGAFSLALHDGDDTVLEIGNAKDLGHCNVVKKDGRECGQWVNATKTEICEWHLNAQIAKTQAKRMGVNAGTNGFGSRRAAGRSDASGSWSRAEFDNGNQGLLPLKQGRGFDRATGSHFYVTSSNSGSRGGPVYNREVSTVGMLDLDDGLFVAEGQFQRDKGALLQKRLASQAKERDIAKKLADFGSGSNAGAEYMRRRVDGESSSKPNRHDTRGRINHTTASSSSNPQGPAEANNTSQNLKTEIGRKRAAQDVRLSPIKKTRFLTASGIKEAGRESTGPGANVRPRHEFDDDDDDDDDELDII